MVARAEDLPAAMVSCFAYGDTALVERFVEGAELALAVIDLGDGPVALPAVEIEPESGVFDYSARYTPGLTEYHSPARLADDVAAARPRWRSRCTRYSASPTCPAPTRSSGTARSTSSR